MVCSCHDCSARKVECTCHLLHLCAAHALGFEAHGTAIQVNLSTFREDVDLVEGVEYVKSLGKHAVFLPQHHVVAFELVQCCLCKGVASGQCVGNDGQKAFVSGIMLHSNRVRTSLPRNSLLWLMATISMGWVWMVAL